MGTVMQVQKQKRDRCHVMSMEWSNHETPRRCGFGVVNTGSLATHAAHPVARGHTLEVQKGQRVHRRDQCVTNVGHEEAVFEGAHRGTWR